jgi:hypothetical protein
VRWMHGPPLTHGCCGQRGQVPRHASVDTNAVEQQRQWQRQQRRLDTCSWSRGAIGTSYIKSRDWMGRRRAWVCGYDLWVTGSDKGRCGCGCNAPG